MKTKLITLLVMLTTAPAAFAYIDPGSGSAIMSAVIGFFIAIGMAIKTYWYKIKGWFGAKKKQPPSDSPNKQQDQ